METMIPMLLTDFVGKTHSSPPAPLQTFRVTTKRHLFASISVLKSLTLSRLKHCNNKSRFQSEFCEYFLDLREA